MNEQKLATSEHYSAKKICLILLASALLLWLVTIIVYLYSEYKGLYSSNLRWHYTHNEAAKSAFDLIKETGWEAYSTDIVPRWYFGSKSAAYIGAIGKYLLIFIPVLAIVTYFWMRKFELVVTNRRVYGRAAFGKRVDIPIDSVSAIATIGVLKGISVASSSGMLRFLLIKNSSEIYNALNDLLIKRQSIPQQTTEVQNVHRSNADELVKYKALLDQGAITQEEFNAMKKQLLDM